MNYVSFARHESVPREKLINRCRDAPIAELKVARRACLSVFQRFFSSLCYTLTITLFKPPETFDVALLAFLYFVFFLRFSTVSGAIRV